MSKKGLLETLREGVISSLNREFDESIYGETILDFVEKPCFSVKLLDTSQKLLLGNRRTQRVTFEIIYFPKEGNAIREGMQIVADRLYEVLSLIEQDGECLAPTMMKHEVKEEKLYFMVGYQFQVILGREYETMGTLTYNGKKAVGFGTE